MNHTLKKNFFLSIVQKICAIVFPVITSKYATSILKLSDYGAINVGKSIIEYFVLFSGLGIYSYAIRNGAKIREEKETFNHFASEMFSINIIATIISYAVLCVCLLSGLLGKYCNIVLIYSISIFLAIIFILQLDMCFCTFSPYYVCLYL